jgi:hypothetical protein
MALGMFDVKISLPTTGSKNFDRTVLGKPWLTMYASFGWRSGQVLQSSRDAVKAERKVQNETVK